MKRKTFIRLSSLATLGLYFNPLATEAQPTTAIASLSIAAPQIHVRHGVFNLATPMPETKGLHIQRDVFTNHGLAALDQGTRMTSITITEGTKRLFAVLHERKLRTDTQQFDRLILPAGEAQKVVLPRAAVVFAECFALELNGTSVALEQAQFYEAQTRLTCHSNRDQALCIYYPQASDIA